MAPDKDRTRGGHKYCPGSTVLRARSPGGVQGVGARDFDADGGCQPSCFPVRRERERDSGVKMLVRGETPTSVGKANGERSETARGSQA